MLCNVNRNNSLSFLLHNFSGYLTLNKLLKESYLNTSSNRKLLVFAGNVIRFEYRYKFEDINLRALRPKQNELYIFVDFGLKSVLQFKSVDFYKNEDNLNIQTSDRVYALFRTLDKHFEDQAIFVCPYNKDNMNLFFSENTANQNNSILLNLRNSKFFVDNTFFANLLFSYTGFLEHLSFHYSFFQFYAIHLNTLLFSFYCKIALSQALPVVSLVNNFFNRYYYFNESSYLGFF